MKRILLIILTSLFFLLPFHPFLMNVMGMTFFEGDTPFWIAAWKEIGVLLIFALIFFLRGQEKKPLSFNSLDLGILLFATLSLITGLLLTGDTLGNYFPNNIKQVIWGIKYGVLFLLFFFALRHISFSPEEKNILFTAALTAGSVVILFALAQMFFLEETFLTHFGYATEYGITEANQGISYCHKIENALTHEEFCRIQSTLSGPNQLGAYLLLILPLFFFIALRSKNILITLLSFLMFLGGGAVLLLTWSRSAWIGALAMATAFFVIQARKPGIALLYLGVFGTGVLSLFLPAFFLTAWDTMKFPSLIAGGISLIALLTLLWRSEQEKYFSPVGGILFPLILIALLAVRAFFDTFFWNIILRPSSSQGHWERWSDGASAMIQNPLGLGLGDAGPASARFALEGQTGFLPESWYLQVGLESGFLGLALFLTILILTGMHLSQSKSPWAKPLFLGLVGVCSASLFLHSWESAVVALTFWGLAGIVLAPEGELTLWKKMRNWLQR